MERKAILKLKDGKEFTGTAFGADAAQGIGEVVFNTGIPGYQEILTDPSYAGQIVTLTSPMIGNYGISSEDNESSGIKAAALVVKKLYRGPVMEGRITLDEFLRREGIIGIEDVDTRALTLHLRNHGSQNAVIFFPEDRAEAERKLAAFPEITERDLIDGVSVKKKVENPDLGPGFSKPPVNAKKHFAVVDYGIKRSIIENLYKRDISVTLLPHTAAAEDVLAVNPDALFLSNGPGDPALLSDAVSMVRALIGKLPIEGICLGHQIITIIIVSVVSVLIFTLLAIWTRFLSQEEKASMLRSVLESVIDEYGEKGLLEMAGVPVDEIHYSYEDLPLFSGDKPSWQMSAEESRAVAIYNKAMKSVVQIVSASELSDTGQGAGVIISPDGYIVTNRHVTGTGSDFIVRLADGSVREAVLVGSDSLSDVSVLKANAEGLDAISIGSSDDLSVGSTVYAIGHPYGYTWSLTRGIVSGLDRMVSTDSGAVIPSMIQTDALINPGNSGGPLLSSDGTMAGLVSSIYSRSGGAEGVSFALPSEVMMDVAEQIISTGESHRGWLDILSVELNSQIAEYSGLSITDGILVSQVVPGGEADKGGLRGGNEAVQYGQSVIYLGGDVITAINGKAVNSYSDYFAALFDTRPGDRVELTVMRNGRSIVLNNVVLVEQTEDNSRWLVR